MNIGQRINLAWRVLTYKPCNLMAHAKSELGEHADVELLELLLVFSSQGHSGGSAEITTAMLSKLLRFEPIGPLLGTEDEWVEIGEGLLQNRRCGRVFKDKFKGSAYDIEGVVWEDPDGSRCVNGDSHTPITFPYMPTTRIVSRQAA